MVKIERTSQAPATLAEEEQKANGNYRQADVVDLLLHDFHQKCYICGMNSLQSIEVEHLRPHHNGQFKHLKFDWNNLFLSCPHCNSVKNQPKYDNQILDCCQIDPEDVLTQELTDGYVRVSPRTTAPEAIATAQLIEECFGLENTGIRTYECKVRVQALETVMTVLFQQLSRYRNKRTPQVERTLRAMLSRQYQFAGFTRTYVRQHLDSYPELDTYLR